MLKVDEDHLGLGAILLVLVHMSPTKVSQARKNSIYPFDMIPNENYKYMSRICSCCLLPTIIKRACGYLVMTRFLMIGVDGNLVE